MPNERHYSNELNLESVGINLPYNMQAEQSVLGAVLLKPETLTDLVEIIRPEMFYTRQNAQIYSEMLRLFTADQTIDFVTLLDAVISDGVFPNQVCRSRSCIRMERSKDRCDGFYSGCKDYVSGSWCR